jgi:hypothetical protein
VPVPGTWRYLPLTKFNIECLCPPGLFPNSINNYTQSSSLLWLHPSKSSLSPSVSQLSAHICSVSKSCWHLYQNRCKSDCVLSSSCLTLVWLTAFLAAWLWQLLYCSSEWHGTQFISCFCFQPSSDIHSGSWKPRFSLQTVSVCAHRLS